MPYLTCMIGQMQATPSNRQKIFLPYLRQFCQDETPLRSAKYTFLFTFYHSNIPQKKDSIKVYSLPT